MGGVANLKLCLSSQSGDILKWLKQWRVVSVCVFPSVMSLSVDAGNHLHTFTSAVFRVCVSRCRGRGCQGDWG